MAKAAKKPTTKKKSASTGGIYFKDPEMAAFHEKMIDMASMLRKAVVAPTPKKPKKQE